MADWQKIETAPQGEDETPVIVAVRRDNGWIVGEARYVPSRDGARAAWWWANTAEFDFDPAEPIWPAPEFWQPLPEPPPFP